MILKELTAIIDVQDNVVSLNYVDDLGNRVFDNDVKFYMIDKVADIHQDVLDMIDQHKKAGVNVVAVLDNRLGITEIP